jgi:hypothetical protein
MECKSRLNDQGTCRIAAYVRSAGPSKVASRWAEFSNRRSWQDQSNRDLEITSCWTTQISLRDRASGRGGGITLRSRSAEQARRKLPIGGQSARCADNQMSASLQFLQRVVQKVVDEILALPQRIASQGQPDRAHAMQGLSTSKNPYFPMARGAHYLHIQRLVSIAMPARVTAFQHIGGAAPDHSCPRSRPTPCCAHPALPLRLEGTVQAPQSPILDFSQGAHGSRPE